MTEYYYTSEIEYAVSAFSRGFQGVETLWVGGEGEREWQEGFDQGDTLGNSDFSDVQMISFSQYRFPKTTHNMLLMSAKVGDYIVAKNHPHIGGTVSRIDGDTLWLSLPYDIDSRTGEWLFRDDVFDIKKQASIEIKLRDCKSMPIWGNV